MKTATRSVSRVVAFGATDRPSIGEALVSLKKQTRIEPCDALKARTYQNQMYSKHAGFRLVAQALNSDAEIRLLWIGFFIDVAACSCIGYEFGHPVVCAFIPVGIALCGMVISVSMFCKAISGSDSEEESDESAGDRIVGVLSQIAGGWLPTLAQKVCAPHGALKWKEVPYDASSASDKFRIIVDHIQSLCHDVHFRYEELRRNDGLLISRFLVMIHGTRYRFHDSADLD